MGVISRRGWDPGGSLWIKQLKCEAGTPTCEFGEAGVGGEDAWFFRPHLPLCPLLPVA